MKTKLSIMIMSLALAGTSGAQSINVTTTGVGIGTATPTQKLDVAGNVNAAGNIVATGDITAGGKLTTTGDISTAGKLTTTGNVGIGTTTPATPLHVSTAGTFASTVTGTAAGPSGLFALRNNNTSTGWNLGIEPGTGWASGPAGAFYVDQNGIGPRLTVTPDGNVGIGTLTPTEKLEVKGNLKVNDAVLSPAGLAPIYGCRAWVNFDGTRNDSGVVDASNTARYLRGVGNVSSVVKLATGSYEVRFNTPMPDTNYAFTVSANCYGVNGGSYLSVLSFDSKTTTYIRFVSFADYPNGSKNDKNEVSVTIIR